MEWDSNWNAGFFLVLAINALWWGFIGFAAFAYLVPKTKGQQVFWGLVIVSLVVWASLHNTFSPISASGTTGPGGQPYEDYGP